MVPLVSQRSAMFKPPMEHFLNVFFSGYYNELLLKVNLFFFFYSVY